MWPFSRNKTPTGDQSKEGIKTNKVEELIRDLKDRDSNVRDAAAKDLGEIKDTRAVEPLITALKDKNGGVRWRAAASLGEIGDVRAVKPLIAVLKDGDSDVRLMAVGALGKMRVVEPLIAALKDENRYVRGVAAEALGYIGNTQVSGPLENLVQNDLDSSVRRAAQESLAKIKVETTPSTSMETPKVITTVERGETAKTTVVMICSEGSPLRDDGMVERILNSNQVKTLLEGRVRIITRGNVAISEARTREEKVMQAMASLINQGIEPTPKMEQYDITDPAVGAVYRVTICPPK